MTAVAYPSSRVLAGTHDFVVLAWGWRRAALGFAAGAIGALAMPSVAFAPAMIVALTLGVLLIDGAQGARGSALGSAFAVGWFWGFGYFLAGLWWLGAAFLVDAAKFAWALPLGVVALPAVLAFFPAVAFAFARALWSTGPRRVVAFAVALTTIEWLRSMLFTGFPWNDIGMTLGANLVTAQIAAFVGLHGLTFLTVLIGAAPATLWRPEGRAHDFVPTFIAALGCACIVGLGLWRLNAPPAPEQPKIRLRLVQPGISQGEDFSAANADAILKTYFTLSDRATSPESTGIADVTHLFWPESAFPFLLARQPEVLKGIASFLQGGAILVTGAARADALPVGGARAKIFNAIQLVDKSGLRPEFYDKRRLVPFGEYVPFEDILRRLGITQFVALPGGFSAGTGSNLFQIPGLPPALAQICYEAIFPIEIGTAFDRTDASAQWILNLTDDAWFGLTPGPYQHFAQARLRAIELGLPLVRVANTGISAILDGRGRTIRLLPLGDMGVLDGPLPAANSPTLQRNFGSLLALAVLLVSFAFVLLRGNR